MPGGKSIEPKPILGIDSQGMLCSASELGLGDDHSGILILPQDTPVGVPYGQALGIETEIVFDVDLTRNRPDCWGHLGVARDVAANLGVPMSAPPPPLLADGPSRSAGVELVDGDRCPRFTTLVLSGIRVAPSPQWLVRRLQAAGMRAINNVVDVSNAVMLELNQPNHAYDLDTLGGHGFRIRLARDGEVMTTLDGIERALVQDDLLICDANDTPIGIGGVMGGLDSEITDATTVVALEIAMFEQTAITRTMNRLGLRSEASGRFERGVDPYGMPRASGSVRRAAARDVPRAGGPRRRRRRSSRRRCRPSIGRRCVRISQVNRILGTSLDAADDRPADHTDRLHGHAGRRDRQC